MKLKKLFLCATAFGLLSLSMQSCDDDDFPPSMAEQNIETLQSYRARTYRINSDACDLVYADITGNYQIDSPYLIATINGRTYCFDMNKMLAIEYLELDETYTYVTLYFE